MITRHRRCEVCGEPVGKKVRLEKGGPGMCHGCYFDAKRDAATRPTISIPLLEVDIAQDGED